MVKRNLYTEGALPAAVHPMSDDSRQTVEAPSQAFGPIGWKPGRPTAEGTESGGQGAHKLVHGEGFVGFEFERP